MTRQRLGGREARVNAEEAYRLRYQESWTLTRLGEHYGVSKQAVSAALKKYEESLDESTHRGKLKPQSTWPWVVAQEHASGDMLYRHMLALRKQREGQALSPADARMAQKVLQFTARADLVITYHRALGFTYTPRKPEDGDEIFVVRSPEWWAAMGHAA